MLSKRRKRQKKAQKLLIEKEIEQIVESEEV
jgi:hypothetical protein